MKNIIINIIIILLVLFFAYAWLSPNSKLTLRFPFVRPLEGGEPQIKKKYFIAVSVVILIALLLAIFGLWRSRSSQDLGETPVAPQEATPNSLKERMNDD
jgi:hypothetical protein